MLTGRFVPAAEAAEVHLVNRVVPAGTALAAARELAGQIAANGPLAVRTSKRILDEAPSWPPAEAFARQQQLYEPVRASADATEGARAFREKRAPVWQGR